MRLFLSLMLLPRTPTLFPYTTLFRSAGQRGPRGGAARTPSRAGRAGAPRGGHRPPRPPRSEEHTSELQSRVDLVCRLLLEKKKHSSYTSRAPPHATTRHRASSRSAPV